MLIGSRRPVGHDLSHTFLLQLLSYWCGPELKGSNLPAPPKFHSYSRYVRRVRYYNFAFRSLWMSVTMQLHLI